MNEFKITKEQILDLMEINPKDGYSVRSRLKQWFPDAFDVELVVGKWYKSPYGVIKFFIDNQRAYGINAFGQWSEESAGHELQSDNYWILAKTEEVESALIAEAKKRGFKEGVYCKSFEFNQKEKIAKGEFAFGEFNEYIYFGGVKIYNKGKWAELIPTLTIKEAEEKLGVKIV